MKLKCLGGINDGEWHEIDSYYRNGDWIKIHQPSQMLSVLEFNPEKIPSMVTEKYEIYRVTSFHFAKDDEYKFLVPKNWTDKEAILHQLKK